eukprot:337186_1
MANSRNAFKEVSNTNGNTNNSNTQQANIFELCNNMNEEQARKRMIRYLLKQQALDTTLINHLDFQQQQELHRSIELQCLDSNHFEPLLNMLQKVIQIPENEVDEFELDIDSIDNQLQVTMYNYMLDAIQKQEHSQHTKRARPFIDNTNDDLEKKRRKYDDYSKELSKHLKKIKEIHQGMDGYALDYEMQMNQLTAEKIENVKKINNLMNIIKNNKKKELELINKNKQQKQHLIEENNNIGKLQQKNNELMQQKNELNVQMKKYNNDLLNEKKLTKELKEKIININKINKNKLNELQKQNEELNGKINLYNGQSNRICALSVE